VFFILGNIGWTCFWVAGWKNLLDFGKNMFWHRVVFADIYFLSVPIGFFGLMGKP